MKGGDTLTLQFFFYGSHNEIDRRLTTCMDKNKAATKEIEKELRQMEIIGEGVVGLPTYINYRQGRGWATNISY